MGIQMGSITAARKFLQVSSSAIKPLTQNSYNQPL